MHWLFAPFGVIGVTIVAMVLSGFVTLPVSVVASAGVLAWPRRRPVPAAPVAVRRNLLGAVLGLVALWAWALAFERPGQRTAPVVMPAVALLVVLTVTQALCCFGMLRRSPREATDMQVLAGLLLWAALSTSALAYELHRGEILGAL